MGAGRHAIWQLHIHANSPHACTETPCLTQLFECLEICDDAAAPYQALPIGWSADQARNHLLESCYGGGGSDTDFICRWRQCLHPQGKAIHAALLVLGKCRGQAIVFCIPQSPVYRLMC